MKTKTTHPTKIGENTNTRNFFQKSFILLAILSFTSFGFKAKAQLKYDVRVNNTSSCKFLIKTFDGGGNFLDSFTSFGLTNQIYGCFTSGLVTVNQIDVSRSGCSVSFYATSTTSGVINYASSPPSCPIPCASILSITCAGGGGGTHCGGTNDFHYLIEIF